MKVATAEEMRAIDRAAIEKFGMPEVVLMENAGLETAKTVERLLGKAEGKRICIFSGCGNNGGDGFVAARHLANRGAKVKVYLIGNAEKMRTSAAANFDILQNMDMDILHVSSERDWDRVKVGISLADCLIDALLGTGAKGEPRPDLQRMICMMNNAGTTIVAVDLPSGVDADTGQVASAAIRAAATVTFALPKPGLFLYPAAALVGEIFVADIGIPNVLLVGEHIKQNMINTKTVKQLLTERSPDVHKGRCGKVLVVAGSRGMTGAAVLASKAALRAGAGVVTLAIAESLHEIAEMKLTEVMTYPLPEMEAGVIGESALQELLSLSKGYDVVAIGPGIGRHPSTQALVAAFAAQTDCQIVMDADALCAFAKQPQVLREMRQMPIITPHLGEMAVLSGMAVMDIERDLICAARSFAAQSGALVVMKSARTVVADSEGAVYINIRGNAGMATAGAGDVLAGIISGLFAQGMRGRDAAVAGVYLHGFAGDLAARAGMIGLVAGDLIEALPAARAGVEE